MKKSGIFIKVFIYTTIFMVLLVTVAIALFSQQFISFYRTNQMEKISNSYQRLQEQLSGIAESDFSEQARQFYENNQSFQFYIEDKEGNIIYATPNADTSGGMDKNFAVMVNLGKNFVLRANSDSAVTTNYNRLIAQILIAIAAILAISIIGALIFARQMTKPIRVLVANTEKMANLEDVPPALERRDELGTLACDVHAMYDKLKDTISKLEDEILREREMEETQLYFFSAASHELKTPIAATGVLLEGMLENVGDYKNHPKYLRECIKMMDAQGKMISEILEIVSLNDGKIIPVPEKLNIGNLVADLLPGFQTLAEADGQSIVVSIPDGQDILADSKMLKKSLSNVILNAVQNTPKGGEIRIWSEPVADQYRVCVMNMGAKIDDAVLPKLFDPFYRMDKARSRKSGRNGLGLTIVQKTLDAMGVDFSMENTEDGVLFWLDLPEI